jgi:hypothetical protein
MLPTTLAHHLVFFAKYLARHLLRYPSKILISHAHSGQKRECVPLTVHPSKMDVWQLLDYAFRNSDDPYPLQKVQLYKW